MSGAWRILAGRTRRPTGEPVRPAGPPLVVATELIDLLRQFGVALCQAGDVAGRIGAEMEELAQAYGVPNVHFFVVPTGVFVRIEGAQGSTVDFAPAELATLRLDQISRLYDLLAEARARRIPPAEGIARLAEMRMSHDPGRACYYIELDLLAEAERVYGADFAKYLEATYEPVDPLFRLAEQSSVVLLNGGGFDGPEWSIRVSLANLDDLDYLKIGHHLHTIFQGYWEEWRSGSGNGHRPTVSGSGTPAEQRA